MNEFKLILLAVIAVTGTFVYLAWRDNECSIKHGVLVRGIVGYDCVEVLK